MGVLASGYTVAVDMLTRADDDTDAAPDVSIFPSALDPSTGERQLEEIAFEVLDTERLSPTTTGPSSTRRARSPTRAFVCPCPCARVVRCDDVAALERWLDLAVTAARADDLFDG